MVELVQRAVEPLLANMGTWFPIVSLSGPRQCGKSTLARMAFPGYRTIDLDQANLRAAAQEDALSFLKNRPSCLIIDEAQNAPDLFPALKVVSDESGESGQYVITGSQNYLLMKNITQSLAGRVGLLKLLPFSFREVSSLESPPSLDEFMLKGGYPRLYDADIPLSIFFESYVSTYVERDVLNLRGIRNASAFGRLLEVLASMVGGLLNKSALSRELDIDWHTLEDWLSVLEKSYIVYLLRPYSKNIKKRLTKTPKVYFYDTGLLCHLLGIHSVEELLLSGHLGAIFENAVVVEFLKKHFDKGVEPRLCFYRDDSKREIDLLDMTSATDPRAFEIKSSGVYHEKYAQHLRSVCPEIGIPVEHGAVIYRGPDSYNSKGTAVLSARDCFLRE